jgi:hypothetical protein
MLDLIKAHVFFMLDGESCSPRLSTRRATLKGHSLRKEPLRCVAMDSGCWPTVVF